MYYLDNLSILKKSFRFALDSIYFHDELVDQKKGAIAKRILSSALEGICYLQNSFKAEKKNDFLDFRSKAVVNFRNVVYWLSQCEKSGYLFNEELLKDAVELLDYCSNDIIT